MSFLSKCSIKTIVTGACLALALIPVAVTTAIMWKGTQETADSLGMNCESIAVNLADKIDRNLFERYGDVQAFGLNHAVHDHDSWYVRGEESPIVKAMNGYVDTYDIYFLTLLVDMEGKLIAVNDKDDNGRPIDTTSLYGKDYSKESWFRDCVEGRFYESNDRSFTGTVVEHLYTDEHVRTVTGNDELTLGFSAPVYGEDGEVVAVWKNVAKFGLVEDIVLETYRNLKSRGMASAEITLLDKSGNVIIDCDPMLIGQEAIVRDMSVIGKFNLASQDVLPAKKVVQGESGFDINAYHTRKKITQVAGYSPLTGALGFPGMEWNVLVRIPCSEALASVANSRRLCLITIALTVLVVSFLSFYISRAIGKGIGKTVHSLEAAADRDYSNRLDINTARETTELSNALNHMLEELTQFEKDAAEYASQFKAVSTCQAVIEFDLDGTIRSANDLFLQTVGYQLDEVQGKHHRMFVEPDHAASAEYRDFWAKLNQGEFVAGEFHRVGKGSRSIWLLATYFPIKDVDGKIFKVVKYATDITESKELEAQVKASAEREKRLAEEQKQKVSELLSVVNAVAEGDLSVTMPDLGDDDVGQICTGVGKAVTAIREAMLQVSGVAATVSDSAGELSSASEQISSGAQQQASSLEETAASLEEITSAVKQNTDNSQQARQLSAGSREIAESGGKVVSDAVKAMTDINAASKKIAEIITTIDEIAFQTNLLALNAAVEAARAGEQGRGFAVVASEVRNLAQRSAGAAKEIKNLIQDSVNKVENGTELVNKSGETLDEIVTSVKRVADIVSEISAASTEQLTGIEQVNGAVSQMDRVTQSNAAQTEEMTGTSQFLLAHADELKRLVAAFRLNGSDQASQFSTQLNKKPAKPPAKSATTSYSSAAETSFDSQDYARNDSVHELDLIGAGSGSSSEMNDFEEF